MGSVMKILRGVGSLLRGLVWDTSVGLPGNILGDMISDVVQSAAEKWKDARAVKRIAVDVTQAQAFDEARELLAKIAMECGAPDGKECPAIFGEELMIAMRDERITSAGMYKFLSQSPTYNNLIGVEQRIVEDALDELREALLTVHFKALNGESKALYKCIEALMDPQAFARAFVRELRGSGDGVMPPVGEISRKYAFAYIKQECPECKATGEHVRYHTTSGTLVCGACGGKYTLTQNLEGALSKEHFDRTLSGLEKGLCKHIDVAVEDINAHADENTRAILEAIRKQGSVGGAQGVQTPTAVAASAVPHGDAPAELTYVYFGEYPQSIKSEDVRILPETDHRGYHKGSDGAYYAKIERGERIEEKRHRWFKGAKRMAERLVPRYYKVEPIRWRMLSRQGERVFLLCDTVLDAIPFGDGGSGGYDRCGLRSWLNCIFYDAAFSAEEKRHVLTTCVENGVKKGRVSCGEGCNDTNDKVFALSKEEATHPGYGFLPEGDHDERRRIAASAYAKETSTEAEKGWWLRSPSECGGQYHHQLFVGADGRVAAAMVHWSSARSGDLCGIVPALCAVFTADELAQRCEPPTAFAESEAVAPKTEAQTEKPVTSPVCRIRL